MQGTYFAKLLGQALPMPSAILADENLAQIGTGPQMHGLQGVGGHGPDRAVDGTGQVHFLPVCAVVFADQQTPPVARRAIAVGKKYHASVIEPGHDGAGVLPGRVDGLELPMQTAIGAAVQTLVGGGVHQALVIGLVEDGDAMHIRRNQSLIACMPRVAVVMTDKDAANFNAQPHRVSVQGIKQNLRDPRGSHVEGGELLQAWNLERLPSFAAVMAATNARWSAADKPQLRVLRVDGCHPNVLQRRRDGGPPRTGFVPSEQTHVGASQQPVGMPWVTGETPDTGFEVHARVAVGVYPGHSTVLAEPRRVSSSADVDMGLQIHGDRRPCTRVLNCVR